MRVLISGTCPAPLNSNYGLLREITLGFEHLADGAGPPEARLVPLEQLCDAIAEWRPAIALLVGGLALETIPLPLIRHHCERSGARLVFWSLEDPYELDCMLRQGHWFDLICTSDFASLCFYPGQWAVRHLPLASPQRTLPAPGHRLPQAAGWFFCGVPFPNRRQWIDALVRGAPRGLLVGPEWPSHPSPTVVSSQRISVALLRELYAVMPLTLYLGRTVHLANRQGVVASTPGPRLFECAGSGGRQLVCGTGLETGLYYEPEREILWASTPEEAIATLHWAASHPDKLAALGERAWQRTQAEHLYRHRAARLLSWVAEL